MATETVKISEKGINSSRKVESDWELLYIRSDNRWKLLAKAICQITKIGGLYYVNMNFYVRAIDKLTPIYDRLAVSIGDTESMGFDTVGTSKLYFNGKNITDISDSSSGTHLGYTNTSSKDVSIYYVTTDVAGVLSYDIDAIIYDGNSRIVDQFTIRFKLDATFYGTKEVTYTIKFFKDSELISTKEVVKGKPYTTLAGQKRSGKFEILYKSSGTNNDKTSSPSYADYSDYWYNSYGTRFENATQYTASADQNFYAHYADIPKVVWSSFFSSYKSPYTEQYWYTVNFYNNGSLFATKDTNKGKIITTYSFRGWECNKDGKLYGGSEGSSSITLYSDVVLTAKFNSSKSGEKTALKLSGIPSKPGFKGHKFVGWFFDGGEQVTSSSMIDSDRDAHSEWTPVDYKVSFDLNGGKMPTGEQKPGSFMKTYGTGVYLPTVEPKRVGYLFVGWGDKNNLTTPQEKGSLMDDRVYDVTYTDTTTGSVTLFAIWKYNPNVVRLNYYWYDTSDPEQNPEVETYQYNIDSGTVRYGAPSRSRPGDYVFLGWSDLAPNEWKLPEYINAGYHGVYNVPPLKIIVKDEQQVVHESPIDLPLFIDASKLTKEENWGREKNYYGIWSKTGKYIMVNNQWKKVSNMYVRINDKWCQVTGAWTFVDDQWKEEI